MNHLRPAVSDFRTSCPLINKKQGGKTETAGCSPRNKSESRGQVTGVSLNANNPFTEGRSRGRMQRMTKGGSILRQPQCIEVPGPSSSALRSQRRAEAGLRLGQASDNERFGHVAEHPLTDSPARCPAMRPSPLFLTGSKLRRQYFHLEHQLSPRCI